MDLYGRFYAFSCFFLRSQKEFWDDFLSAKLLGSNLFFVGGRFQLARRVDLRFFNRGQALDAKTYASNQKKHKHLSHKDKQMNKIE